MFQPKNPDIHILPAGSSVLRGLGKYKSFASRVSWLLPYFPQIERCPPQRRAYNLRKWEELPSWWTVKQEDLPPHLAFQGSWQSLAYLLDKIAASSPLAVDPMGAAVLSCPYFFSVHCSFVSYGLPLFHHFCALLKLFCSFWNRVYSGTGFPS